MKQGELLPENVRVQFLSLHRDRNVRSPLGAIDRRRKGIRTERSNLGHTTNTHRLDGQTRGRRLDEGEYPPCLSLVVLLAD